VTAREGRDLVAIAASGHRAPPSTVSAGGVVKEQAALGVGTRAKAGTGAFGDGVRSGTSNGCKKPVEAAFPRYELDSPFAMLLQELIVSLGDAEDVIDGLNDGRRRGFSANHSAETIAQSGSKETGLSE
jgi:hypothetical protein